MRCIPLLEQRQNLTFESEKRVEIRRPQLRYDEVNSGAWRNVQQELNLPHLSARKARKVRVCLRRSFSCISLSETNQTHHDSTALYKWSTHIKLRLTMNINNFLIAYHNTLPTYRFN